MARDVALKIFSHLSAWERLSLMSTCRAWQSLLYMIETIDFEECPACVLMTPVYLRRICGVAGDSLRVLRLNSRFIVGVEAEHVLDALHLCPRLRLLTVFTAEPLPRPNFHRQIFFNSSQLEKIFDVLPCLEHLEAVVSPLADIRRRTNLRLHVMEAESVWCSPQALRRALSLPCETIQLFVGPGSVDGLDDAISSCGSLTTLILNFRNQSPMDVIVRLALRLKTLKTLVVEPLTWETSHSFSFRHAHLQRLSISVTWDMPLLSVVDTAVAVAMSSVPDVSFRCPLIPAFAILAGMNGARNIRSFSMCIYKFPLDAAFGSVDIVGQTLRHFPSILRFSFNAGHCQVEDSLRPIFHAAQSHPSLTELSVRLGPYGFGCGALRSLIRVVKRNPRIRAVIVRDCQSLGVDDAILLRDALSQRMWPLSVQLHLCKRLTCEEAEQASVHDTRRGTQLKVSRGMCHVW